jgi:S1-C subfamily serine protease
VADRAELRPGMVVLEAGRSPVGSAQELRRRIHESEPGSVMLLKVQVDGVSALRALPIG